MSQYVREKWGIERGFPRGPVYSIAQTADGYLWIGTEKGLVRFDGLSFRLMQSTLRGLPSLSHILGLVADRDGSLWARLRRPTLLRYYNGVFQDSMEDLGRPQFSVAGMTRARDGALLLWVLDGEPKAIALRNGKLELLASPVGFSRSPVLAVAQTFDGDIWVGTQDAGLFRVSGGRTFAITKGLPDLKVNALVAAGNNELWVGTDSGIVRWDGTKLTNAGIPHSLDSVQVLAMTIDRDANLWVGTNSRGLLRLNAHGVAFLEESSQGASDAVTAVFQDREGNLWTGSASGLERLRDSAFVTYSHPEGLPSDGSTPIFVDSGNRTWFAPVNGGLWWVKDGQHGRVTNDGLDRDVIYSIAGRDRELWIGRQHGGLTRLRDEQGSIRATTYTQADGLAQDSVYSIYQTRDGTVWAGTLSGGTTKFSDGRFTNYTIANGLVSNTVNSILEDSDGTMWFATPGGLSALSKGHWRAYTAKDGLPSEDLTCLLEDSTGVLWVGTVAGLAFRGPGRFQAPDDMPAALREQIFGLAEDRYGSLWVATSNHVLRVNRERLLRGALVEGDVHEYGLADGLRGMEGVKRHQSVVRDPAGRIWFSLNRGISVVDPARLRSNSPPAIAHIQMILADGSPIRLQQPVHVPGGRQRITFDYTGLSLSVPERVRFRYQLDGFDHGWSEPVATREAVYTNLSPGAYRFRVIASNPDGVWSSKEAAVGFEVDPLFWQTWWFRASVILACLIAGLALYRYRLHQVTRQLNVRFEERLAERTRIAQELHDTLLQGFLSASMQVHVATDRLPDDSQVKPTLTRALQLMGQVIEEGRNTVRGLRSSHSPSFDLEQAFSRIQEELVMQEEVGFRVIVDGEPRPLHPVFRDEVYRIGHEALINAFRHSKAKSIEIEIQYSSSQFRILVRDDGCGIDPQVLQSGLAGHWGLVGMRERAERIGAQLHLWSNATGTEVELSSPSHIAFQDHFSSRFLKWFGKR
jgi:ligand-binding sensor domain-containing protein/signal transduction histidine kinase